MTGDVRRCSVCQRRPEDKFAIVYNRETQEWDLGPGICNACYDRALHVVEVETDDVGDGERDEEDDETTGVAYLRQTGMPLIGGGMAHMFADARARRNMEQQCEWRRAPPIGGTVPSETSVLGALLGSLDGSIDAEDGNTEQDRFNRGNASS